MHRYQGFTQESAWIVYLSFPRGSDASGSGLCREVSPTVLMRQGDVVEHCLHTGTATQHAVRRLARLSVTDLITSVTYMFNL